MRPAVHERFAARQRRRRRRQAVADRLMRARRSTSALRAQRGMWLRRVLDAVRGSYWCIPLLVSLLGLLAGLGLARVDELLQRSDTGRRWVYVGEAAGARAVLSMVGTAAVSIASLTFSVTIVALTLASSQFGSRLLYNFMRDRFNQVVLGAYVGTYLYSLMVLRSIQPLGDDAPIASAGVTVGVALGALGIGLLVFFFHHVADSIQATSIVARVGSELMRVVERMYPEADEAPDPEPPASDPRARELLRSDVAGTLLAIDVERLVELARDADAVVHVVSRPGQFVVRQGPLARISRPLESERAGELRQAFAFGERRTLIQDVEFAIHQLVEVAVRALSPGVNDPFTAQSCVDHLGNGLAEVMRRGPLVSVYPDDDGVVRVRVDVTDFDGLVRSSFDQIRQHGRSDMAVMIHLLETLAAIAPFARHEAHREALRTTAEVTCAMASDEAPSDTDRQDLRERHERLLRALERSAREPGADRA